MVFQYGIVNGTLTKILNSPNNVLYLAELITHLIKSLISAMFDALSQHTLQINYLNSHSLASRLMADLSSNYFGYFCKFILGLGAHSSERLFLV